MQGIGYVGGLLEGVSMVAHQASGGKMDKYYVSCENLLFSVPLTIKHHSGSPITLGFVVNFNLRYVIHVNVKTLFSTIMLYHPGTIPFLLGTLIDK